MSTPSEQVKDRLDVAEVIGGYIKLNQAGANLKGLCPFHHEKTPSFYVSKEKQIWHCFGCNQGGDIFSFVMKMDGLEFPDALRMMADRAGIEIRREDPRVKTERTRMHDAVKAATAFYEESLQKPDEAEIREYVKKRGLTDATREAFHIGYAPASIWDGLLRHLKFKGYRPEEIERAGLAVRNERGEYRDRFHNRLMFPLFDAQGNAVGFSGRHYDPRHQKNSSITPAKYVNTPETLLYSKSRILYGLHAAKKAIREKQRAVLVEGQFDLILSHQTGVEEAVATSGTALTPDHVRLLKRYTSQVYTAFDSDSAGDAATKRSVMMLLGEDIAVRIIRVEGGKDPADIAAEDPARWQKAVAEAEPLMEYYLRIITARPDFSSAEGKRVVAGELLPMIRAHANPVLQGHYLSQLAGTLGVEARILQEAMQKLPAETFSSERVVSSATVSAPPANRWIEIEEYLIAFLVKHAAEGRPMKLQLSLALFSADHTRMLFPYIHAWLAQENFSVVTEPDLPADLKGILARLLLKADRYAEALSEIDAAKEIGSFIHELKMRQLRETLRNLSRELSGANAQLQAKILTEFQQLSAELQGQEKHSTIGSSIHAGSGS